MPSYTRLKGVSDISQNTLCDNLESNIIEFFQWGLLCIGGFGTVKLGSVAPYGGDMSKLRLVNDPYYQPGQVWEAFRSNWVWESGVEYSFQPIQVSGVYVNNVFYPTATSSGTSYYHYVNYPLGRIVFNSPIPTNSNVQVEYSYRLYNFQNSDVDWFRQIQYNSLRIDSAQFLQVGSGAWDVLAQNRVQLPAVIVEVPVNRRMEGYQLGGGQKVYQDVRFHIYAENPSDRRKLFDAITYQKDKTIAAFDKDAMAAAGAFPLDYHGSIAPNALCYPSLVLPSGQGGFYWNRGILFGNMAGIESVSAPPLFQAIVRSVCEVYMPEL